jgi:glutathione S-transferase
VTESAYILHRLLQLAPDNTDVETVPSNDSIFWAHFAEGSQMNLLQAGAIIGATGSAWGSGKVGGLGEEGRAAVGKYAGWVSEGYLKPQNQNNLDQVSSGREPAVARLTRRSRTFWPSTPASSSLGETSPGSAM